MRLITLILTFLIAFYAYFYFFPLEKSKETAPPQKEEPKPQPPPNQSATHLKRRDYSALKESVHSLTYEEKMAVRKKIYLSLLNAIQKNNPQDIENLKSAFEKLPQDPEQQAKVTHALVLRNVNALKERSKLIGQNHNSPEIKQAFDELLVIFSMLDNDQLTHTKDLLKQGEELFSESEIKQRKALLARASEHYNNNPAKAISLLELYPEAKKEVLALLINTENKKNLNHYLNYASQSGIMLAANLDAAALFEEARHALANQDYDDAILSFELLSRTDPSLTEPTLAYAIALYDQEYYDAFLNEISSLENPSINEKKALAYIWIGNKDKGLEVLKNTKEIHNERSYRELAIDFLKHENYAAALNELNQIHHPYYYDDAIIALIKFKQKEYEQALAQIEKLPKSFKQTKAIKTLEVYSLLELGKDKDALDAALSAPINARENSLYDPFFDAFEKEISLSFAIGSLHLKKNNKELALKEFEKSPLTFNTELEKARLYLDAGKPDEAISALKKAYSLKNNISKDEEALFERLLGLAFYDRKEYLDAFLHFKKFKDLKSESIEDLIPRIETAFKIERYDIAKMLADKLEDSPLKTFYIYKINHFLSIKDEPATISNDVIERLNDVQKKEIALIYFNKGLYAQGKKLANTLASKSALLEIWTAIGDFKLADPLVQEVALENTPESYHALALYYNRTSQNQAAYEALNSALKFEPYNLELLTAVYAYPRSLDEIEKLSSELKIIAEKPESTISSKVLLGRLYLTEGIAKEVDNKDSYFTFPWEKAQLLFANILKEMPDAPSVYLNQGQTYLLLKKFADSVAVFNKGIELAQFSPELFRFKAIALSEFGNNQEALKIMESAVQKSPNDPSLWSIYASIQQDANYLLEARYSWQNYIKLKPKDPEGYFALAALAERLNNPESAIQSISKIIALDPGNEKARIKLKTLLSDPLLRLSPKEKNKLDELIK